PRRRGGGARPPPAATHTHTHTHTHTFTHAVPLPLPDPWPGRAGQQAAAAAGQGQGRRQGSSSVSVEQPGREHNDRRRPDHPTPPARPDPTQSDPDPTRPDTRAFRCRPPEPAAGSRAAVRQQGLTLPPEATPSAAAPSAAAAPAARAASNMVTLMPFYMPGRPAARRPLAPPFLEQNKQSLLHSVSVAHGEGRAITRAAPPCPAPERKRATGHGRRLHPAASSNPSNHSSIHYAREGVGVGVFSLCLQLACCNEWERDVLSRCAAPRPGPTRQETLFPRQGAAHHL
ncbi:Suppressor of profilin deletion, partial [Frankliniella fusca]